MRCEGSDIAISDSGSNPASKQRAMAIQAVLIQLMLRYVTLRYLHFVGLMEFGISL